MKLEEFVVLFIKSKLNEEVMNVQVLLMKHKRLVAILSLIMIINLLLYYTTGLITTTIKNERNSSYVTLCSARLTGDHRTGNHLFMLSAMLDFALKTNREIIIPSKGWVLDQIFDFDLAKRNGTDTNFTVRRYELNSKICPCEEIHSPHYDYDIRFNESTFIDQYSSDNMFGPSTVEMCGLSQTSMHGSNAEVEKILRSLPPLLKDNAYSNADLIIKIFKRMMMENNLGSYALYSFNEIDIKKKNNELMSYIPLKENVSNKFIVSGFNHSFETKNEILFVGVHVRMGDFLQKSNIDYGLTVADATYFRNAFAHFIKPHKKIVFAVMSDDIEWAVENFVHYFDNENFSNTTKSSNYNIYNQENVKIVFFRDTLPQDFAILFRSDALIISTGTFGWWAAWLNYKAPIVYYKDYPRPGSALEKCMNTKIYYPKEWTPMT